MQFTSNIIIALLLAVSNSSTVTATQKSVNLRGGGSNLQEEKAFSDPSPSGLSSIMNDAANPLLPNRDCSLADAQWGGCRQMLCLSIIKDDCYCH